MTKSEIIDAVAKRSGSTKKDTEIIINALGEEIKSCLARGEEARFIGFGTFTVKKRSARKGRNPRTGEEMDVPAATLPVFKYGKLLRSAVDQNQESTK